MTLSRSVLDALDLKTVKLYGRFTAEHIDEDFELTFLGIYLIDRTIKALERPVSDGDNLTDTVVDLVLGLFEAHSLLNLLDLVITEGCRFGAATDETGDGRCVANDIPGIFAHFHLDDDVTLENALLNDT